jgi:hypothetical protein
MPTLTGSVGEGGENAPHDVILVQVMLLVIKDPHGATYYHAPYDGKHSRALRDAITAFQADQSQRSASATERKGVIAVGSGTWAALVSKLPAPLKEVRTAPGIGVAYLAMGDGAYLKSVADISKPGRNLNDAFKSAILKLVRDFYERTGIVISVQEPWGWWRTFDDQVGLSSEGGPGESIHHYGWALDLGFRGLRWVDRAARVQAPLRGDLTDGTLELKNQMEIWAARNAVIRGKFNLYHTLMRGDLAHIQGFMDDNVDSVGHRPDGVGLAEEDEVGVVRDDAHHLQVRSRARGGEGAGGNGAGHLGHRFQRQALAQSTRRQEAHPEAAAEEGRPGKGPHRQAQDYPDLLRRHVPGPARRPQAQ